MLCHRGRGRPGISASRMSAKRAGGLLLVAARVATLPLGTLATILLTHWLTVQDFGSFATAMAFAGLMACVSLGGIDQIYLRGDIDRPLLNSAMVKWSLLAFGLSASAALLYPGFDTEVRVSSVFLVGATGFLTLASPSLLMPQRSLDYASRGRREIAYKVLALVPLPIFAVLTFGSATRAASSYLTGAVLVAGTAAWVQRRHSNSGTALAATAPPPFSGFWRLLRRALPFSLASALFLATRQLPVLLLASTQTAVQVAHFRVAATAYAALQLIPAALNNDLLRPRLYSNPRGWRKPLKESLLINALVGLLLPIPLFIFAPRLLSLLFGAQYSEAQGVLRILLVAFPLFCLASWMDALLAATRHNRQMIRRLLFALIILLLLGLPTSRQGPEWLAVTVLASEAISVASTAPLIRRVWKELPPVDS